LHAIREDLVTELVFLLRPSHPLKILPAVKKNLSDVNLIQLKSIFTALLVC